MQNKSSSHCIVHYYLFVCLLAGVRNCVRFIILLLLLLCLSLIMYISLSLSIRCIDKASQYYKEDIQAAIKRHLLELLSEPTHRTQSVDYIQSLMENYTDGERSLSILLPHGLSLCLYVRGKD